MQKIFFYLSLFLPEIHHISYVRVAKFLLKLQKYLSLLPLTMFQKSMNGQVIIAFKPEAFRPETHKSEIEKILSQYKHQKVLNLKFDLNAPREKQVLALSYVLKVPPGVECFTIQELTTKYGAWIEHAYPPSIQDLF